MAEFQVKHIGMSGTRHGMTDAQQRSLVERASQGHVLGHHGCCVGADEQFHWILFELGLSCIGHPPTDQKLAMKILDDTPENLALAFQELRDPRPYLDRNEDIVNETSELWAFPYQTQHNEPDSRTGGTWYTIRYALNTGKPVKIIWPDGSTENVHIQRRELGDQGSDTGGPS